MILKGNVKYVRDLCRNKLSIPITKEAKKQFIKNKFGEQFDIVSVNDDINNIPCKLICFSRIDDTLLFEVDSQVHIGSYIDNNNQITLVRRYFENESVITLSNIRLSTAFEHMMCSNSEPNEINVPFNLYNFFEL